VATGDDAAMKTEMPREQILDELSRLRCEHEMVRRKTKELGNRTTRLYLAIEDLNLIPSGRS
jgi:hypothetical protein